jgi:threonyl-tRNA synthetase
LQWGITKHSSRKCSQNSREHHKPPEQNFEKTEQERLSNTDHRLLGQQLDLFSLNEDVGVGLVLWHPKGNTIRNAIRDYWETEHCKNGYQLVCTPHIARKELWQISGHLNYYSENMYCFDKEGEGYVVKPMNCPFHIQIFKARQRSYRELPIRYAEWGTVYRYERSGTLHGLLRVRGFTQDDAHIFCTPAQAEDEIFRALDFALKILQSFGFKEYKAVLSTCDPKQPEKYMGTERKWRQAQNELVRALVKKEVPFKEVSGEAVFYGPKIDVNIVDAVGREWQCTTIQFDFNLPKRFKATYVGDDNKMHEVIMIHRALLGSIERFCAILLEHYSGNLPTWLAPIQVSILPVTSDQSQYAEKIMKELLEHGIRAEIDASSSTVAYRIRQAELAKIPYMAICGKQETETNKLSIRKHRFGNMGKIDLEELVEKIEKESQK